MAGAGTIINLDKFWSLSRLRGLGSRLSSSLKGLNIGSKLTGFSKWLSGLSWSGIAKGGLGAAIVGGIYSTWHSLVGSVSDVTGMSEDTTEDVLFILLAVFVVYVIYKAVSNRRVSDAYNSYQTSRYYKSRADAERARARSYERSNSNRSGTPVPKNRGSYSRDGVRMPVNRPDLRSSTGVRITEYHSHPLNRSDLRGDSSTRRRRGIRR